MVYRLSIIGQLLLILWDVHEPTHWFIVWPVPSRKTWFARCRLVLFWTYFIVYEVTNAKTVITQKGINWWVIEREYEVGWNLFKYHIVWFLELTSGINYCTKEFQSIWSAMFKYWHVTNSLPALWLEFNTMGCRIKWFSLFPWNSYGEKIKTKLNSLLPHQTILFILTFREVGLAAWYLGCCQMT